MESDDLREKLANQRSDTESLSKANEELSAQLAGVQADANLLSEKLVTLGLEKDESERNSERNIQALTHETQALKVDLQSSNKEKQNL
eukprot:45740-Eustigmatos_ZCMA.PRE.1